MSSPSVRPRAVAGALALGAILVAGALVSPSALLATVASVSADPVLFGLVVAGLYLGRPLLALPTTPLAAVVGYGYGVAVGVPVALLGVVATVVPVFVVARWIAAGPTDGDADAGRSASASVSTVGPFGSILERAGAVVGRYYETAGPIRGVVASRLAPIPSDVATCAAAVSDVRLRHLVIGTAIGELPWTVAAVAVGASAATIRSGGLGELGVALALTCFAAAIALVAAPAYRLVRGRRGRNRTTGQTTDR